MNWNRNKFPWVTVVLAACAVGAGLGFSFLIQVLLPSYKNTVVTVSDVPEINQLLYVEDTEKLIIFPWDQFDAAQGIPIRQYEKDLREHEYGNESFEEWEEGTRRDIEDRLQYLLKVHQTSLENWPDVLSYLKVDDKAEQWLYLKEMPVRTENGQDCLLDAAWRGMGDCAYFHVYKKEPEVLLDSTLESANRYLDSVFQENWLDPDYLLPYEIEGPSPNDMDPITEWMVGLYDLSFVESLLRQRCERIVYHDEILLVYSIDQTHRVVLFYDPIRNYITGFSIQL